MMQSFMRRTVLGALSAVALAGPALADKVTMNLGYAAPEKSVYGVFADLFDKHLTELTNGEIEIKIRCCGQISSEDTAFKAMQLGTVDAYVITTNNISPHWPLMDVTVLPYIFQSPEHMLAVAAGPVGEKMQKMMQEATSLHLVAFGGPQYRDFYNSKRAINTMADMEGLKIRVPKNEVMLATFEAFGAEPVPLAWSETPTALQTGTVDGGDNGTTFIRDMKFYEFEEHLVILEHFMSMAPLIVSDVFMRKLSEEQRAAMYEAGRRASKEHTEIVLKELEEVRTWLVEEGGMKMTRPDKAEFIAAAQGVQEEFAQDRDDEFRALLAEIRAAAE